MDEHSTEATGGLHQLEGYLLWHAEVATAQRDAAAFTDRLSWLTTGQQEEIASAYVQERLQISRRTLARIAQRCRDLRSEYEERYRRLKGRLIALFLAALALEVFTLMLLTRFTVGW